MAMRVVAVARDVELWARQAGWSAAAEVLAHRRGHAYDPAVVDAVPRRRRAVAGRRSATTRAPQVLDAEPRAGADRSQPASSTVRSPRWRTSPT